MTLKTGHEKVLPRKRPVRFNKLETVVFLLIICAVIFGVLAIYLAYHGAYALGVHFGFDGNTTAILTFVLYTFARYKGFRNRRISGSMARGVCRILEMGCVGMGIITLLSI